MLALANKTIVSLRKNASAVSGLEDEVLYGMKVKILSTCPSEEEGDHAQWCYVRTHYRYEGYCRMEELVTENCIGCPCSAVDPVTAFESGDLKIIMQPYADILSEPRVQSICLQSIPRGGRIRVIGPVPKREGWMEVALVDGRIGMYLGANLFIHSTGRNGSDGVVINSLNPAHELYREDLAKSIKAVGSIF